MVGSAVGDALGAPFEFGPAGAYAARFPDGVGTMCGGGGWEPGEATDDTQMAVLVAESLLERGGFDPPDLFDRFRRWADAGPKDIGLQTEAVLTSGAPWCCGRKGLPGSSRRPVRCIARRSIIRVLDVRG